MKKLLAIVFALSIAALAQGARYDSAATSTTTGLGAQKLIFSIPNSTVYVCTGVYIGQTCTSGNATVYSDVALTQPISQPLVSDDNGNFGFYYNSANSYYYTVTPPVGSGGSPYSVSIALGAAGGGSGTFTNLTVTNNAALFQTHINGDTSPDLLGEKGTAIFVPMPASRPPVVTHTGSGSSTWGYASVEITGGSGSVGSSTQTTVNASVLSSSVYNSLSVTCNSVNDTVQFYRVQSGGTPSSTGGIGSPQSCSSGVAALNDTGLGANNVSGIPIMNMTGSVRAGTIDIGTAPSVQNGQVYYSGPGQIRFEGGGSSNSIFQAQPISQSSLSSAGINFFGNKISISEMGQDGSPVVGTASVIVGFPQVVVFPFSIGLGGGGTTNSDISIWPSTYTGLSGVSEKSFILSSISSGGFGPANILSPVQAALIEPQASVKSIIVANPSGLSLNCSHSTSCSKAGMYEVDFYLSDFNVCSVPGTASVSMNVTYTDMVGLKTLTIPLQLGNGTVGTSMGLGTNTNIASGSVMIWSTGATNIQLGYDATACTTGTAEANIVAEARRLN